MNLKTILEDFDKEFIPENKTGVISMERYLNLCQGQKKFISNSIKSILEDMPLEEKKQLSKEEGLEYGEKFSDTGNYKYGFNKCIQEIRDWRDKVIL